MKNLIAEFKKEGGIGQANLQGKAGAIWDGAPILVCALVHVGFQELIDEVAVCAMDLHAMESCPNNTCSSRNDK